VCVGEGAFDTWLALGIHGPIILNREKWSGYLAVSEVCVKYNYRNCCIFDKASQTRLPERGGDNGYCCIGYKEAK
jgi:hypothetical protein